jgi:hypothetical protein
MISAVLWKIIGPAFGDVILTRGCGLETLLDLKHANNQESDILFINLH